MVNISGWTEGILFTLAFVAILTVAISSMNLMYNQNYDLGITDNSNASDLFVKYQDTAKEQAESGEVGFDATQGITLKSSYGMMMDALRIIWSFLTGGFIENIINNWNVGEGGSILAGTIRVIWVLSLISALLYALFKVFI